MPDADRGENSSPPTRRVGVTLRLRKRQKLRRSAEFARIYQQRVTVGDSLLLLFGGLRTDDETRFGLSVSKKHGNAVARNRIKRLLREAFRLEQADLPVGLDMIVIPRQGAQGTIVEYRASVRQCAKRLHTRLLKQAAKK